MQLWVAVRATAVSGVYTRLCAPQPKATALRIAGKVHGIVPWTDKTHAAAMADRGWVRWPMAKCDAHPREIHLTE